MKELYEILQETANVFALAESGEDCSDCAALLEADVKETIKLYGTNSDVPDIFVLLYDILKFAEWAPMGIDEAERRRMRICIDAELCEIAVQEKENKNKKPYKNRQIVFSEFIEAAKNSNPCIEWNFAVLTTNIEKLYAWNLTQRESLHAILESLVIYEEILGTINHLSKEGSMEQKILAEDTRNELYRYTSTEFALMKNECVLLCACKWFGGYKRKPKERSGYAQRKDGSVLHVVFQKSENGIVDGLAMSLLDEKFAEKVFANIGSEKEFLLYYDIVPKVETDIYTIQSNKDIGVIEIYGKEYNFCGSYPVFQRKKWKFFGK